MMIMEKSVHSLQKKERKQKENRKKNGNNLIIMTIMGSLHCLYALFRKVLGFFGRKKWGCGIKNRGGGIKSLFIQP